MPVETILNDLEAGEQPVLLTALRDQSFIPRPGGRKLDKSCPFRWAKRGKGGIKLETLKTPTGLITTRSATLRFFAALSGGIAPAPHGPRGGASGRSEGPRGNFKRPASDVCRRPTSGRGRAGGE
jgi:hypothetical protein